MRTRLMNNIGLKILAFLLAMLSWLIVVNIDDPVTSQTYYNIPVTVINEEVLAEQNQTYQIVDDTQMVTVTVKAKRSVLNRLRSDNITAVADMKELTLQTQVPIVAKINSGVAYESIEVSPRNLQVKLEDEETKKFPIVPTTTGTVRDGYALGEITTTPEMVSIRGPKSVISAISKVEAAVSVSGLSEDTVIPSELVLYDAENNVIDQSLLANNLGTDGVAVNIQVLEVKSVDVDFDTSLVKASEGYTIGDVVYEPTQIQVTGSKEVLDSFDQLDVPAAALSFDNLSAKTEKTVDITKYLPEGIALADAKAGVIAVTISVIKDGTKSYDISRGSIVVNNLSENLSLAYETVDVLEVQIRGPADTLNKYEINDNISIDLKGYTEPGTYTVPVNIKLPEGCTLENAVTVNIKLDKK